MAISADSSNRGSLAGEEWSTITPNDTTELSPRPRAIMVNVAGNLAMVDNKGNTVTFAVAAGIIYPLRPLIVKSSATTATGITGIY